MFVCALCLALRWSLASGTIFFFLCVKKKASNHNFHIKKKPKDSKIVETTPWKRLQCQNYTVTSFSYAPGMAMVATDSSCRRKFLLRPVRADQSEQTGLKETSTQMERSERVNRGAAAMDRMRKMMCFIEHLSIYFYCLANYKYKPENVALHEIH